MTIRSKAPLRLGLAGGGTDIPAYYNLYGGSILNVTVDMYAYCTIVPTDAGEVVFTAADLDHTETYKSEPVLPAVGKLKLHQGVYNRIVSDYNQGRPLAFRMITYSDAPPGSGLGSSSTMVVAIIKAYVDWLNLPLGEYDIASLAYEIERKDLRLEGGKQDQYAATFGGFNFMEFSSDERVVVNPLRIKRWVRNELENSLVLFYTGVSRESAHIIQEQIANTESRDAKSLESLHEIKRQSVLMKEALLKGDFAGFSRCLTDGWLAKKSTASTISNSFIDELYDYAMANGADSAKISGAGGGGFMMLYVDPVNRVRLINGLKKREGQIMTPSFTEIGTQAWVLR